MTSWHLSAFAMSSSHGIGIAEPQKLAVFRPLFVSVTLPSAVIRKEKVSIVTTVFSYMTTCTTVSTTDLIQEALSPRMPNANKQIKDTVHDRKNLWENVS